MKQPVKALILIFVISVALTQCGKHATVIDPDFIGVWNANNAGTTYVLSIDNGSNGYWHGNNHGVFETAQGVARVRHGKLCIGLKAFNLVQYPLQDSLGTFTMNLSGVIYTRQ